jgi:hypothetical protein
MLAGAARLLARRQASLPGTVIFMFQPGEEGYHGARVMLEEGLLDAPTPPTAEHATPAASSVIGLVAMPSPVPSERAAAPAMGLAPPAAAGFATAPGVPRGGAEVLESPRPRERSADVPFAPHSDAFARDRSHAPHARAERRVFSSVSAVVLLIVTIVLISAAVGVWVGRWMTQH